MVNHNIDVPLFFTDLIDSLLKTDRIFDAHILGFVTDDFLETLILIFRIAVV